MNSWLNMWLNCSQLGLYDRTLFFIRAIGLFARDPVNFGLHMQRIKGGGVGRLSRSSLSENITYRRVVHTQW